MATGFYKEFFSFIRNQNMTSDGSANQQNDSVPRVYDEENGIWLTPYMAGSVFHKISEA